MKVKYSIIITCFNRESFVGRSIRSAINQRGISRDSYEVIVVDDKSTDRSKEVIKEYDNLIKFIENKSNIGLPASRNKGIKAAKGDYVMMLDSDDFISQDTLNLLGLFLDHNQNWHAVSCDYYKVNKNDKVLKRCFFNKDPIACGILYRIKSVFKTGLYNKKFKILEDEEFRRRYLKNFNIANVQIPLYRYTMHKNNLTKNKKKIAYYKKKLKKK
jgi:glycosyltransferase involved in cell wall biosynthesis